ncbi:MAG: TolC family protein [Verrucomicrobia bacterium]|nr:MAG: TolC family protein [Verrucomicrobiota bacterium]PYX05933.1 MAG: TolC family protein [Acidobacteriota bacterium]HKN33933.1 TolC family protein [Terriglobales bacterium]
MQSTYLSRSLFGCTRISLISVAVLVGTMVLPAKGTAQQTGISQQSASIPESPGMAEHAGMPTSLRELIQEAEEKNPQIAASFHTWQASRNVPKQASALPETQFSVQQFSVGSPRPFAGYSNSDFAYIGFGASQDIPYPGKRRLRARVAEHEADSMEAQTDSMRRTVVANLKMLYFHLAYIQQTLGVLQRSDALLTQVQEAAEARYRVGQGNQQDVLKAQLQHTKILQEIAHHHQEEGLLEAQIKQVLGRSQESADIVAESLTVRSLPYAAAELLQRAREQNPDVHSKQASIRQQDTQVELAHKEFRPDFNVGYTYEHTASQFKDYYMASFSVRLPNRGRQRAALAEAEQNRERARQELDAESQRVLSEVQQQYVRAKTSEERLKIYSDGLVPQSEATFQSALSAYQSNRQDFESLLSGFLDVLNLDLEYRNELVEHESALAELERLTGVDLP